jgi:hypothetical protein
MMLEYVLRWLMPASIALEGLKRPLEAPKTVNEGQGSLNTVQGLKSSINKHKEITP